MSIPLNDLLRSISSSVQDAQNYLDYNAITAYLGYFETITSSHHQEGGETHTDDVSQSIVTPIMKNFSIPSAEHHGAVQTVNMPLAALSQHNTMKLDTVTVRLNAATTLDPKSNMLLLELEAPDRDKDTPDDNRQTGELEFVFRSAPCSEGIARLNQNNIRQI